MVAHMRQVPASAAAFTAPLPSAANLEHVFRSRANKPVIGLDIDGVLGDYHKHFLAMAALWLGSPMPHPEEINPGLPLSRFMGVPHEVYREIKLAYRQGGFKRWMPAYPFANELTQRIRCTGTDLWLCTTRPYLRLDNIDPDTREWLERNRIEYDAILWEGLHEGTESTKYADLVNQVGLARIVAVVDDLPEQTADAERLGIGDAGNIYLRDQPYNREPHVRGDRITSLEDLWDCLSTDIAIWKARHDED